MPAKTRKIRGAVTKPTRTSASRSQARKSGTVLVTGGNGRLGRRLCSEMVKSGLTVRCLVNFHTQMNVLPPGVIPYVGDITNTEVLRKACDGVDAVYHFAAIVSQRAMGPSEIVRVNATGTAAILEAAEFGGVEKFVFPSSVDVYGRVRSDVLTEDSALHPTDMYGHSKMLAERQIMKFGGRMSYTILRMATIYGQGFEGSFFKVFRMIKEGKLYIIGDGNNKLSLVHINDVVRAMILAKESKAASYRIYNLTDGKFYTQKYLIEMAAQLLGVPTPTRHAHPVMVRLLSRMAGIDADELRFITSNRQIDITRIKKELGFIPRMEIRKSSKELVDAFMLNYKNR